MFGERLPCGAAAPRSAQASFDRCNRLSVLYFPFSETTPTTAQALIDAAHATARKLNIRVSVAVTDMAGHLKAFRSADAVGFLSIDVAIDKNPTASSFGVVTHVWNEMLRDPTLMHISNRPRMVPVGGGFPIVIDGQNVGAIGVSGGSAEEDQQIAEAALLDVGIATVSALVLHV